MFILTDSIFQIQNLSFAYHRQVIYDQANLTLTDPGVYGLIGPNGSGKSTLFNLITRLLRPAKGTISLDGTVLTPARVFASVAYAQDSSVLYPYLTGRDHLRFVAKQHGVARERINLLSDELEVTDFIDRRVARLSLGQKQRLLIALALLPESRLLLMDEPLNGLDPDSVIIIRDLLEVFKTSDQIVIVSSHNLDELDKVTDRLIFKVDHGLSLETVAEGAEVRYAELYRHPRKKLVHHA